MKRHLVNPHRLLKPIGFRKDGRPIYPIAGADGSQPGNPVLARLQRERDTQIEFCDRLLAEVERHDNGDGTKGRDLSETEKANLESSRKRIGELDNQIKPLKEFDELRGAHQQTTSRFTPTGGGDPAPAGSGMGATTTDREHKYRSTGEFLADVYKASGVGMRNNKLRLSRDAVDAAAARLRSHGLSVEGEILSRAAEPHNTTDEVPGLLPTSIVGPIMSDVDAARPFISSIGAKDLGGIPGLTFERPTITQHVQVAKQANEKDEVANRQFIVGGIPFTKDTYGGWANVSRQSIDWTSPGVWDALMTDFIEQYGLETENAAADAFAASVTQEQELTTAVAGMPTLQELLVALYGAAAKSYQGSGRLPDTIWASLDQWALMGPIIDHLKATTAGDGGGDSSMGSFAGNLLRTDRIVVPSFPAGTLIVGVKSRTEVYEDRFGFLSVIQPRVFGVEVAYGGSMASGTVKPSAFTKIVNEV